MKSNMLSLRQQADVRNEWLRQRLDRLLPELMARENFDMWLVIAREYNEDPILMTLLPEPAMSARRRTILVFARNSDGHSGYGEVDRLTLSRYGLPGFYESGWKPGEESQHECLARLIRQRDPQRIGLNFSPTFAFGDGLSLYEYQRLAEALGGDLMSRTTSAERLCVGWLERRIEPELVVYPGIVAMGHAIIAEAFSNSVIQPGITTSDDVVWWMRERMQEMGLRAWFQPTVEIQAPGQSFDPGYSEESEKRTVIMPGDLLHCDMGFIYLGLATDQQQHAYVLKPGERDAPEGLKAALAAGNRVQDLHMAAMQPGLSGNDVLHRVRQQAEAEGLKATIYSHPLGYHGHAAGPTIGLWDQQGGVPGRGDYPLFDETVYSIELNVQQAVGEWADQVVRIALEEDAVLSGGEMRWLAGRQSGLHLIGDR